MDTIDTNDCDSYQEAPCGYRGDCLFHRHCLYALECAQQQSGATTRRCPHCNEEVNHLLLSHTRAIHQASSVDMDARFLCDHIRNLITEIMEKTKFIQYWCFKLPLVYTARSLLHDKETDDTMTWNVVACIVELLHSYVKPDVGVWVANNVNGDASMRKLCCFSNHAHNGESRAYELVVELQRVAYLLPKGSVARHEVSRFPYDGYELTLRKRRMCDRHRNHFTRSSFWQ